MGRADIHLTHYHSKSKNKIIDVLVFTLLEMYSICMGNRVIHLLIFTASIVLSFELLARNPEGYKRTGRYTLEKIAPIPNHLAVFDQIVSGFNVQGTVNQGLKQILMYTSYKMADLKSSDPLLPHLLDRPLPITLTGAPLPPTKVIHLIEGIIGEEWYIVIDPVHRLISFEIKPELRNFFEYAAIDQ